MKTTGRLITGAILFLAGTVCAFALEIKGEAPKLTNSLYQDALDTEFEYLRSEINKHIKDIASKPENLIKAFGNSQVFASSGAATQRGYGEYKTFCVTLSPVTLGFQLYDKPDNFINDIKDANKLLDKLNRDGDIKLGFNPQVINARIGLNTSKFLLNNLYLGLRIGYMKLNGDDLGSAGLSFDAFSIGATANYQLVPSKKVAKGLLLWRGVNVGTGFIYSGTKIGLSMNLGRQEGTFSGIGTLTIDPKMVLDFKIDTFTIPVEVTTAVKLLWFLNIPLGVGADFGFGKSDLKVSAAGDMNVTGSGIQQQTPGYMSLTAGGDMSPTVTNFKVMSGVGINIGPVIIDIPVTYYPLDNGYSVGFSIGAVW